MCLDEVCSLPSLFAHDDKCTSFLKASAGLAGGDNRAENVRGSWHEPFGDWAVCEQAAGGVG